MPSMETRKSSKLNMPVKAKVKMTIAQLKEKYEIQEETIDDLRKDSIRKYYQL